MKRTILFIALAAGVASADPAKPPAPAALAKPAPLTPEEVKSGLYAFGFLVGQRSPLSQSNLSPEELERALKGFTDAALNKPLELKPDEAMPKVQRLITERAEARAAEEKKKGIAYLEKAAAEPGAQKLPSGAVYTELTKGTGPSPEPTDTVRVNYRAMLTNGKEFDSSYSRNTPLTFPVSGRLKCWAQGLPLMKVGGKSRLVCPSDQAYGDRPLPGVPPGSTLVFEIELLDIPSKAVTGLDAGK